MYYASCAKVFKVSLCFISPRLLTTLTEFLKCILLTVYYILLFCVFMAVFFIWELDVVPDTEFGDHNRKLSLQKLPRITKKIIKCVSRAILF